jgi:hypothetical protein
VYKETTKKKLVYMLRSELVTGRRCDKCNETRSSTSSHTDLD